MKATPFFSAFFLTACVTINIYFPAAAAEQVADEIIKGIQSEEQILEQEQSVSPQSQSLYLQDSLYQWLDLAFNILVPPAHAAGADLSVNTAEIRKLRAAMKSRFTSLKPFYANGTVAINAEGLLVARGSVPLKVRNKVNKLVSGENSDRNRLYKAIANANGHPEWFTQIKSTFSKRWVGNAQSGWWYQTSNGSWKQK